jgi:hypothetical protein
MADEKIIVEYNGFQLIQRVYPGTTTCRIRRPDGTWRYSEPTVVSDSWSIWVVARRLPGGDVEELEEAASFEAARRWVDQEFDRRQ